MSADICTFLVLSFGSSKHVTEIGLMPYLCVTCVCNVMQINTRCQWIFHLKSSHVLWVDLFNVCMFNDVCCSAVMRCSFCSDSLRSCASVRLPYCTQHAPVRPTADPRSAVFYSACQQIHLKFVFCFYHRLFSFGWFFMNGLSHS